jgi:hypothetical protein
MIENITIVIPQLVVGSTNHFPSCNKEFLSVVDNFLPPTILAQKLGTCFVRHAIINEDLAGVFLRHWSNKDRRQGEGFYCFDVDHYSEQIKIESICRDLFQLSSFLVDLVFSIDFMVERNVWPPQRSIDEIISLLGSKADFKADFDAHRPFLELLRKACDNIGCSSLHPRAEFPFLADDPEVIVGCFRGVRPQEAIRIQLREVVEKYTSFSLAMRAVLKRIAPEGYDYGIDELASEPYELKVTIPQLIATEGGMKHDNPNFMWHLYLSPNYGQLINKFVDLNDRHLYMNQLLREIYLFHELEKSFMNDIAKYSIKGNYKRILFATETLIYWIRKNIDELIGLQYTLHILKTEGREPDRLKIDSIGKLFQKSIGEPLRPCFTEHLPALERINEISNTFKHSFITSETHTLIGQDEPTVNCLNMPHNMTTNAVAFHSYFLKDILNDYGAFFLHARSLIRAFQWPNTTSVPISEISPSEKLT